MKDYIIGAIAVLALIFSGYAVIHAGAGNGSILAGATTSAGTMLAENYIPYILYNGGYNSAKDISTTANINGAIGTYTGGIVDTSAATTSLSLLSTSASQGVCIPFNATSTATALNMTFAASSTFTQTTVGVIPVIRYGACN